MDLLRTLLLARDRNDTTNVLNLTKQDEKYLVPLIDGIQGLRLLNEMDFQDNNTFNRVLSYIIKKYKGLALNNHRNHSHNQQNGHDQNNHHYQQHHHYHEYTQ